MIKAIVMSLGITTVVSLTVAVLGNVLFDLNHYKTFVVTFTLQLSLSYIWSSILQFLYKMKLEFNVTKFFILGFLFI